MTNTDTILTAHAITMNGETFPCSWATAYKKGIVCIIDMDSKTARITIAQDQELFADALAAWNEYVQDIADMTTDTTPATTEAEPVMFAE